LSGNNQFMSCVMFNARSLKNKFLELYCVLYGQNFGVIFVSETWLNSDIPDSLLDPQGSYNIYRCDRVSGQGGGVCTFISKDIKCSPVVGMFDSSLEVVTVDIFCAASKYRLITIYRKPSFNDADVEYMNKFIDGLGHACSINWPVIIVGDLNCPGINWDTLSAPADGVQDILLDFLCNQCYDQMVESPTRGGNILDLVLTSHSFCINDIKVSENFSTSDHNSVIFSICDRQSRTDTTNANDIACKSYDWSRADFDAIADYLSTVDWDRFMSENLTADAIWSNFKLLLFGAFDLFIPWRWTPLHRTKALRRYPANIRKLINKKKLLWRVCRCQPNNQVLKSRYRQVQTECREALKNYELSKELQVIESHNTGSFYKYVNRKLSRSCGVSCLRDRNGLPVTDDMSKSNMLNEYFSSVGTVDNGEVPYFPRQVPTNAAIDGIHFDEIIVLRVINKIKPKLSHGPDGIPPLVIKKVGPHIAYPLARFFESFMSVGQVPGDWKSAIITPIYKKGLSSDCTNYRPVSLCCSVQKIMERIIASELLVYLRKHNVISRQQHGFLSRRSTVSNLLETVNDWTIALKSRHMVTAVYIDYSKAFDTVSHVKLFQKLSAFGIGGNLLAWIKALLTGRTQRTRVGNSLSDSVELGSSGVIQGSCLGPLLFLLYINDVTSVVLSKCKCKLYADDLKLYSEIVTEHDCHELQLTIDRVKAWSDLWQLEMSVGKCAFICIGHSSGDINAHQYLLGCGNLPVKNDIRDLGVTVDQSLKYSVHIDQITAKAKRRTGLLFRCFITRNTNILLKAYITYIRPLVEYASNIWSPVQVGLIEKIESVQRQFSKRIPALQGLSYPERLTALNLDSLELRRLRSDLCMMYKIVFGLCDVDTDNLYVLRLDVSRPTRGHRFKIMLEHCTNNYRKNFFIQRVAPVWNSLPLAIVDFSSLPRFKRSLALVNLRIFTCF